MKYINVTGPGCTGSSAVIDLLKEYDCISYYDKHYTYEHIFMWHPEALIETVQKLTEQYFGLQTDATIRRFINKMQELLITYGGHTFFTGQVKERFIIAIEEYINKICSKEGEFLSCLEEVNIKKSKFNYIAKKILHNPKLTEQIFPEKYGWYTLKVGQEELFECTQELVTQYLDIITTNKERDYYLLDAFVPETYFSLMKKIVKEEFKNIVVLRDPRDRYLDEATIRDNGIGKAIVPMDPMLYCQNYRCIMEKIGKQDKNSYHLVYFEDLIEYYEDTVRKLEDYLEIDASHHNQNAGRIFNIEESYHNCRMYKQEIMVDRYSKELSIIEEELKEYLVEENDNR